MKLTYFNGRGLAENSRILLAISGEDYEDYRYPLNVIDWATHNMEKKEFDEDKANGKLFRSLNKLPFLEVDGKTISQSKTIERFLARRFNLMGDNDIEAALIDSICEWIRDFKDAYQKVRRLDSDKKEDAMTQWFTKDLVEKLESLEKILDDTWAVGNRMSLADVIIYSFITQFFDDKDRALSATNTTPKIKNIVTSVGDNSNLQEWLKKRPETCF